MAPCLFLCPFAMPLFLGKLVDLEASMCTQPQTMMHAGVACSGLPSVQACWQHTGQISSRHWALTGQEQMLSARRHA